MYKSLCGHVFSFPRAVRQQLAGWGLYLTSGGAAGLLPKEAAGFSSRRRQRQRAPLLRVLLTASSSDQPPPDRAPPLEAAGWSPSPTCVGPQAGDPWGPFLETSLRTLASRQQRDEMGCGSGRAVLSAVRSMCLVYITG